jgi:DNA-binding NarL/FixJ family response regulator
MIKVIIADDHALIREGLKSLLREEPDIEVVAEAADSVGLFGMLSKHPCNVVVLDISMPGKGGLDVLPDLREQYPDLSVLLLTMHPEERFAARAFKLGASGYVTKESVPRELVAAIRKVATGGKFVSEHFAETLASGLQSGAKEKLHDLLSDREFQILRLIASGRKVDEIGLQLCLSKGTVYTYRSRILEKLKMSNDAELTRYAVENKLLE